MNRVKVYNKEGKVVDSFIKTKGTVGLFNTNHKNRMILATGHYVKRNLPK